MRLVIVAAILVSLVTLVGCGGSAPGAKSDGANADGAGTMVDTAKDNASAAACAANRAQLAEQISTAQSTSEGTPPDLAAIVAELRVTCPSGGSYAYDKATGRVACSVHGE